ncbi:hypothetical protein BKA67DRAFT_566291 [Truncatella angustata]|uniref:Secreted protein n=1 Tax=Truncatella angustata TaxID=152316 RepID=A0A9P8UMR5_9PEZI|nr:uncharacterized protein BKA67DRAFT_566291 [Truncatella angustata]KAH6654817.1 hypothetical protein BKA67DRAFT_566291 [Truncatella angustata]
MWRLHIPANHRNLGLLLMIPACTRLALPGCIVACLDSCAKPGSHYSMSYWVNGFRPEKAMRSDDEGMEEQPMIAIQRAVQ